MTVQSAIGSAASLQDKSHDAFISLHKITQACHSILNTSFIAPDPKPAWFDGLQTELDGAKALSRKWIDTLGPLVTGGVPLQVIDFGSTYAGLSQQIQQIVQQNPNARGKDNPAVQQVAELVEILLDELNEMDEKALDSENQVRDWGDKLQGSHDRLSKGSAAIQAAEVDLQVEIAAMNAAIKALNEAIKAENVGVAISAGAVGVGLFLSVIGLALAPVTLGGSLLIGAFGVLTTVGGIATWKILQNKINENFRTIAENQATLTADQRRLVALQGLAIASDHAVSYLAESISALSEFRTSWKVFAGEIHGIRDKLHKAEAGLSTIVQGAFAAAASKEWEAAIEFAQLLAGVDVRVEGAQVPMLGEARHIEVVGVAS